MVKAITLVSVLIAVATAAPLEKRDTALVKGDLIDLEAKMVAMNTAIDGYKGGVFAALPVQSAYSGVETSVKKAAADVTNEPTPVSEEEAKLVLDGVIKLEPMIKHATDGITTKADSFGASKSIVKTDMTNLKGYTDTISNGLVTKSPEAMKAQATALKAKIDGYFDSTLKVLV